MYSRLLVFVISSLFTHHCGAVAPPGPWDAFNFAPASRTVHPRTVHSTHGLVQNPNELVIGPGGRATLSGNGSYIVLDIGQEIYR